VHVAPGHQSELAGGGGQPERPVPALEPLLIRAAADRGTAVLVCSSDEDELSRICDRVIVLSSGTIEADLRGSQISATRIAQHTLNDATAASKSAERAS
jgi:ABC-type multidrug transport system ATPase subunit